jgi:hypothetical protein
MRHPALLRWPATSIFGGALLCVAACLATTHALQAAEPTPANLPTAADVARWVKELDSDDYAVREAATTKLQAAGPVAVEPLSRALLSPSAEVADRANLILHRIASHSDESIIDQLAAAVQKLGSKRPAVAKIAAEFKLQQQKFKHQRAIVRIRALGGGLSGNWSGEALAEMGGPAMPAMMPPPAIAIVDEMLPVVAVEDIPAIDISVIEPPAAIPPAPEPVPPPRTIVGLLERLIAPVAEPRVAPPEAIREEIVDVTPVPAIAPAPVDPAPIPVAPIPIAPPPLAPPAPLEAAAPADPIPAVEVPPLEVPRFAPVELPPIGDPPVAEAVEVIADEILIGAAGGFAVPIEMGMMGEEGDAYAELRLDASFRGTDADLALLKDIPEIYSLSVNGAKLTDAALPHIGVLPRLTTLNVQQTRFSAPALRKLREQRPELSVICRSSAMLGINAGLEGACVLTSVFRTSGAYEAGLRDGDEILEVDGQKVRDFSDLTIAVYPHQPGDKVSVKYRRNDAEKTVEVLLKPRAAVEE